MAVWFMVCHNVRMIKNPQPQHKKPITAQRLLTLVTKLDPSNEGVEWNYARQSMARVAAMFDAAVAEAVAQNLVVVCLETGKGRTCRSIRRCPLSKPL